MKETSKSIGNATRKSQTQIVIEELKRLILENELPAGSNHLESELSEKLGVSRTPIREAILVLEAQGLLEVKPRHGVRISAVSSNDISEIYQIITELEGLSAELAATRNLSDDELQLAQESITKMNAALAKDDREAWAEADQTFHNELVRFGGNSRISGIVDMYNDQVHRIRALTLYLRPSPSQSIEDHSKVLEAIRNNDPVKARKIHTAHRKKAGKLLVELLRKIGFQ